MSAPAPRQQINSQSVCPVSSFTRTPARARVAAVPSSADTARSSCVRAYRGPAPPAAGRPSQVTAPRHRLREITLINTILNMRKCIFRPFNFCKKKYSKIFFAPHFTLERLIFRALKLRAFKECSDVPMAYFRGRVPPCVRVLCSSAAQQLLLILRRVSWVRGPAARTGPPPRRGRCRQLTARAGWLLARQQAVLAASC